MSTPEKKTLVEAIGHLVMRFQDATQQFDEEVGELYGLNAAERHCLSFLYRGPQTPGAIAREIRLTPAAVTALVDRLERRGFVTRTADPNDRRKVLVAFTEQTARMTAEVYTPTGEAGARMLAEFSEKELATFAKILKRSIAIQEEMTVKLLSRKR